jgi:hypothetical protein
MVRTTGNSKISIVLVLSITILIGAALVTGTVINIVSAANSGVKVQPKTYQHPATSIGSTHIVSSAAHGRVNVQPNQHYVTKTLLRGRASLSQCWDLQQKPPPPYGIYYPVPVTCDAKIPGLQIRSTPTSTTIKFDYEGKLLGWSGSVAGDVSGHSGYRGLDNAPIEIKVFVGKDKHLVYQPGVVATTGLDGTFNGTFALCDDPKYSDHSAILTAYVHAASDGTIPGSKYPGPYVLPVEYSLSFGLGVCPSMVHFTDMHITSNPNNDFMFSGKLIREGGPIVGTPINLLANYLDNKPGHVHYFHCLPDKNPTCTTVQEGQLSLYPPGTGILKYETTKADGTFSGSFAACDLSTGYKSDAQLTAQGPTTGVWAFTTMPCSEHLGVHRVVPTIHHT